MIFILKIININKKDLNIFYYVNKEIYDRILKIKNLINYHATKKITDYNFNSINNINNNNFIHNRIELKRIIMQILLQIWKIYY
jgi:hypothetical protein